VTLVSVSQTLQAALSAGVPRLDAQRLLAYVLGCDRSWLAAHIDYGLTLPQTQAWTPLLQRAAQGEPLAYLLGETEFHGLLFKVTPDVLIPRADTETLVDWALEELSRQSDATTSPEALRVIDLGCGSGAIALAIKHRCNGANVTAVDTSPAALAVAQNNGVRLGLPVQWQLGDWWSAVPAQRFNLAVSNPPYIAQGDAHLPALRHEPVLALTSGTSGLRDLRRIIANAPDHLHQNAWLLLEHGHDQALAVRDLLHQRGFSEVISRRDLAGHERCSGGCWRDTAVG
jgi:release factor glutamine methyltransferase